jgi:hypothetical protein
MRSFKLIGITGVAILAATLLIHCSSKDKGTTPGPKTVEVRGVVSFPTGTPITMSELVVGFADADNTIDSAGDVTFKGTEHVPGLGMVMDQSGSALLMGIVYDPQANLTFQFDARSTAEALVFMNPFVCESTRDKAVQTIADLGTLPQIDTLENLLTQKLAVDPKCLEKSDAQLAGIITRSINAYIAMHQSGASPSTGSAETRGKLAANSKTANTILISPTTQTSGHLVTYVGDNTFNITNAYGRWALLVVPQTSKEILLSPNGSMLDFFKDGLPWAPSNTTFNLTIDQPDDTQKVFVYGYGLKNDAESYWDGLTTEEKRYADKAGCLTFVFELLGGAVDVICASNSALSGVEGWERECEITETEFWLLDFMLNDAWDASQIHTMVKEGQYGDLAWFVFKTVFEKITTDETYRLKVEAIMGKKLSEKQLARLEWLASQPATYAIGAGINIGNKVTNVMKTAYAFKDARFKTVFKIWKSNEDFGGITGHVNQKESPYGSIAGVHIHLSGDDNNPIPGHVTDVTTDATGGFTFANIQAGAKSLTATKAGYNDKSVSVTVTKNQITDITIEMSKRVGTIRGIVVNEIYSKARSMPQDLPQYANHDTLFDSQLYIYARGNVAGQPYEDSKTISNGRYTFDLPAGTFWIVAIHPDNDYKPDSMQITTVENEIHDAPRALRMKPKGTMTAEAYVQGSSTPWNINFPIALASPAATAGGISMMFLDGIQLDVDTQEFVFAMNPLVVNNTGYFPIGSEYHFFEPGYTHAGFAQFTTKEYKCTNSGTVYDQKFIVPGEPDEQGCDCGITSQTDLGTIYITRYGTELGDIIEGSLDCKLAGYDVDCECIPGPDSNHDGKPDTYDVACMTIYFKTISFRLVVGGTLTFSLSSPPLGTGRPIIDALKQYSPLPSRRTH